MVSQIAKVVYATMIVVWLLPAGVHAQIGMFGGSTTPSISGVGTTTLKRTPSAVRMYVELLAKGETLDKALGKLKDRHEAAIVQLEALDADKDSIKMGPPSLSNMQTEQKKQMERMIMQRMGSRGKKVPKGLKVPKSVSVSAKLTAQWPLDAKSPQELLLAVEALKEKINDADIAGRKEAEELSEEEKELAEEAEGMMNSFGEEKVPVGEPQFVFLAQISDDEHKTAMAEAFSKAKEQAAKLALAAGVKLGPLVALSGQGGGNNAFENQMMHGGMGYRQQQYLQQLIGAGSMPGMTPKSNEAISSGVGPVTFQFNVQASFGFESP